MQHRISARSRERGGAVVRQLGQLEAVVMDRLWSAGTALTARDVVEALRHDRDIAYTTVLTVLENLRRKDLVTRRKEGRANRYQARTSREAHTAALMEDVLASSRDRQSVLLRFVEQIPPEEVGQLRRALEEADRGERR